MKRNIYILIVSLFFIGAKPAVAQTSKLPNQAQSPKEMILKSPINRRIKVVLLSGETIKGRIADKYPSYCILFIKSDKSPYLVNYSNIKEINTYNGFFSKAKRIAFEVIKTPAYIGISLVQFTYWVAEDLFEAIFRRGRSN